MSHRNSSFLIRFPKQEMHYTVYTPFLWQFFAEISAPPVCLTSKTSSEHTFFQEGVVGLGLGVVTSPLSLKRANKNEILILQLRVKLVVLATVPGGEGSGTYPNTPYIHPQDFQPETGMHQREAATRPAYGWAKFAKTISILSCHDQCSEEETHFNSTKEVSGDKVPIKELDAMSCHLNAAESIYCFPTAWQCLYYRD